MDIFPQNSQADREPYAAGRFYSANKEALTKDLEQLFSTCKKAPEEWKVRAIISPHAGYVFSGRIAASAYSTIPKSARYKNIFVIGSSHVMAFDGASVYNTGDYITPLGKVKVNLEIANKLKLQNTVFRFPVDAHITEHSLEVQLPFIQYYFPVEIPIVPIIIGTNNKNIIKSIAEILKPYFTEDNLFVISSDFSHYPPYNDAVQVDKSTSDAIISGKADTFLSVLKKNSEKEIPSLATSMCGWTSGLTLLYLTNNNPKLEFRQIDYCNSGDTQQGDRSQVVGYNAIVLVEKTLNTENKMNTGKELSFSKDDAEKLISIARSSIRSMLYDNKRLTIDPGAIPPDLKKELGAFVTLRINGKLRGCIGRFISTEPLYQVVNQMAVSSAMEDYRFNQLSKDEFDKTEIEISVLGPLKKINDISEIVIGKHGIYIKKDFRSGTMLPQVATENHWTVEEFLGYTARDKAGIGWTGWKDAEIYVYEAAVLEENKR